MQRQWTIAAALAALLIPILALAPTSAGAASPYSSASGTFDDVFNGVSCGAPASSKSTVKFACESVGHYAGAPDVNGLEETSINGEWSTNIFDSEGPVTEALGVSCPEPSSFVEGCVAVGEHFSNPHNPTQLVEVGGMYGFGPISIGNPNGANWSVLDDVSCTSAEFCLLVGAAGKIAKHGGSTSRATAYRWNGTALRPISIPEPRGARSSKLVGVSCPTMTTCQAVGNFVDAAGRSQPYAMRWTPGGVQVQPVGAVGGTRLTVLHDVACAGTNQCVAVGVTSTKKMATTFAAKYSKGTWTRLHITTGQKTAFFGVSCPDASYCVAVGQHGTNPLIETWNASQWKRQAFPALAGPFTDEALRHVSCATTVLCLAVGYRQDPAVRNSSRALALEWKGKAWTFQKTINE